MGDCIVIHALFQFSGSREPPGADLMTSPTTSLSPLTLRAGLFIAAGGLCVTALAVAIAGVSPFNQTFVLGALVPYLVVGSIAVAKIAAYHPYEKFGTANALTLVRLMATALLGGLAAEVTLHELRPVAWIAWSFCLMAGAAVVVDGLDGYAARREKLASAFGGRFDMEVDALQILLLCVIVFALGKTGAWVLIGGALRYLYEIAGLCWPALRGQLFPSFRRKLISVIQGSTLAALLAPVITPPLSSAAAAIALALLLYSFAVDVVWLAREDRRLKQASL